MRNLKEHPITPAERVKALKDLGTELATKALREGRVGDSRPTVTVLFTQSDSVWRKPPEDMPVVDSPVWGCHAETSGGFDAWTFEEGWLWDGERWLWNDTIMNPPDYWCYDPCLPT